MEKVFFGGVKAIPTQHGEIIKVSFKQADLDKMAEHLNEAGYVNMNLKKGQSGNLYLELDTWKPDKSKAQF